MTIGKRLGWVFIGIVIGWIGSSSLVAAKWAQGAPPRRLVLVAQGKLAEGVIGDFIKDTRTGACGVLSAVRRPAVSRVPPP